MPMSCLPYSQSSSVLHSDQLRQDSKSSERGTKWEVIKDKALDDEETATDVNSQFSEERVGLK